MAPLPQIRKDAIIKTLYSLSNHSAKNIIKGHHRKEEKLAS
jgi:hypothetical protein